MKGVHFAKQVARDVDIMESLKSANTVLGKRKKQNQEKEI